MSKNQNFQGSEEYVASPELLRSVNIAMALEKPLLIKGEPGTGKTMLAQAISNALSKELIIWNIKSTTKASMYTMLSSVYMTANLATKAWITLKNTLSLGK